MRQIDQQYMQTPFYGSRRMTHHLKHHGYHVNRKRIQRLMRLMGIEAIYPKPKRSTINSEHRIYPYLLRDYQVTAANEVWSADITYIPMDKGFMYLVAILDGYSRYVITWKLSNSLGGQFLSRRLASRIMQSNPYHLQYRPRCPVYCQCFHRDGRSRWLCYEYEQRRQSH